MEMTTFGFPAAVHNLKGAGTSCVNQCAVASFENPSFIGFTHRDVSVIWFRTYFHYAYRGNRGIDGFDNAFSAPLENDVKGPVRSTLNKDNASRPCGLSALTDSSCC